MTHANKEPKTGIDSKLIYLNICNNPTMVIIEWNAGLGTESMRPGKASGIAFPCIVQCPHMCISINDTAIYASMAHEQAYRTQ